MECVESKKPKLSSPVHTDVQVSLCDESMKHSTHVHEGTMEKASKNKRASLSSHRRSITGNVISAFHIDADPESQTSSETGSQKSNFSDDVHSSQSSMGYEHKLLPNPVNTQMDAVIEKVRHQISKYDEECKQWGQMLVDFESQEESSKLLAANLMLPATDIPAEIRELAMSEYITCKPVDLIQIKCQFNKRLQQFTFHKESCLQDLQLIKETVETVQKSNHIMHSHLYQGNEDGTKSVSTSQEMGACLTDSKQIILDYLNCA